MGPQLYFLGAPRVELGGQPVELPAKAIALLALLAVSDAPQPRDRVLGLLWGESAEEAARKNLRNTLWALRRALGDDAILAEGDRLSLGKDAWADARMLAAAAPDRAASALQLYRGPFLDGLTLYDAPEFEIWLSGERERLLQAYLLLAGAALAARVAAEEWREVIVLARQALTHDNLHEPFYRSLMEAHARLGERSEALRQYETLKTVLDRDLGVAPLPETEALRQGIVTRGDWEQPRPAPDAVARARPARWRPAAAAAFVGRGAELAALDEEFTRAVSGEPRVALVSGELGIGKTRLWREWSSSRHREDARTGSCFALEARCLEATRSLPFAPLAELFASDPCGRALWQPGTPVAPVWLAEAARLLPEVRATLPGLPLPAVLPPEDERHRLFEALVKLLFGLPARPIVVFVDDVQWSDSSTLDWLAYLVHRSRGEGLLLVLAYRREDAPAPLIRQAAAWSREGAARRLPLDRLTPEQSGELAASLMIDPGPAAELHAQSAGNPYFLLELSRSMQGENAAPVPPALADLVRARLDRLPEPASQVVQAAAVLEPDFDLAALRRTSGRSQDETLDALDALLAAGVLIERRAGAAGGAAADFAFSHPLVAAVVRDGLSGPRRASLHQRAAAALEASHGGKLGPVAARLAGHHLAAGDAGQAAEYYELAARHALSLAAAAEAAGLFRQALSIAATPARHLGLGDALYRQGDLPGARAAYQDALLLAEPRGERTSAVRACLGLAETYLPAGRPDEVVHWARRSLDFLDAQADPTAHARAHFLFGAGRLRAGGAALAEAEWHLAEAGRLAAQDRLPRIAAISRFELGNLYAERGDLPAAIAAYEESAILAEAAGEPNQQVLSHNNAAYHAMLAGDLDAAHRHIASALDLADRLDLRLARQYLYSTRGEIALAEGQWAQRGGMVRGQPGRG